MRVDITRSTFRTAALAIIAIGLWSYFLWQTTHVFEPSRAVNVVDYNSDNAIPVLMANENRPFTIFSYYYYAADRWGGWPFMIPRLIHWLFSYHWTPQTLFLLQVLWIFIGVAVFAMLAGREWLVAGLSYVLVLCIHSQSQYEMFELSQLYAWQVTALLLAWLFLRKLIESLVQRRRVGVVVGWMLITFWFSLLAIWSSIGSLPLLAVLLVVELLRSFSRGPRLGFSKLVLLVSPMIVAIAGGYALRFNYQRHGLKHYGDRFHIDLHLDYGFLLQNLRTNLKTLADHEGWWQLYLFPLMIFLAVTGYVLYKTFARKLSWWPMVRGFISNEAFLLALSCYAMAVLYFALVVVVDHVRIDLYDIRFLTIVTLFAPVSALLLLHLIISRVSEFAHLKKYARPAFAMALFLIIFFKLPRPKADDNYRVRFETAQALAQRAPGGILMGGYWETYLLASLQSTNAMTPVPFEDRQNRMPWTPADVRNAHEIIVEYRESRLQGTDDPPEELRQYGATFTLTDPRWYENGNYRFARYLRKADDLEGSINR